MRPILEAKRLFAERGLNFEEQLGWYLLNGLVVSDDEHFMMAKPINHLRGDDEWNVEDATGWYCHVAVGSGGLTWFLNHVPYRLPYVCFRRLKDPSNKLKCYNTSTFERLAR